MDILVHVVTYASLLVFVIAVAARFIRIQRYPLNLRWELYPVPHEGARAEHGGSILEETDWWTKKRHFDWLRELKAMFEEMVLIKALYDHNRKLWFRSFPFHFALYLLAGFVGLLVVGAALDLAGVKIEMEAGGFPAAFAFVTAIIGAMGLLMGIAGALGLLYSRLTDDDLKPYTNFSHIFNLLFILVVEALALVSWLTVDNDFSLLRGYVASIVTFNFKAAIGSALLAWTILLTSLLIAYIPLTHMSHFFVKWFTWHRIRWDDEPNVRGGRIEALIQKALQNPVTWSADHIQGGGKKTWADVATEEMPKRV